MTDLLVITFHDDARASAAYEDLRSQEQLDLGGIALVHVDESGRMHVETPGRGAVRGAQAATSAVFGALIGLVFFVPVIGLVIGGAVGALFAGLDRTGVDAAFRRRVQDEVHPGTSAVVVYGDAGAGGAVMDAVERHGGTVLRTTLSDADERGIAHDRSHRD
ncbi:DUF1269 domain-containing protein [Curtobacterium sp. PhB136]|uniref:DUF1269 domain-containing protein n=1 Tax=Curtobacterium sp. PhB136 TaxID=2485181 RepID=UPI0010446ED1|nr:DUF1269 domain-containing protein [Curtobacterium sp. PhB136]TCK60184.1 putative membrane protein [Curtobacterium sp. PhB136]